MIKAVITEKDTKLVLHANTIDELIEKINEWKITFETI
jgi:hypothetical protein